MPDPYISLAEAKHWVGINDTDDDKRLEDALEAACRYIDVWCGRRFYLDAEATTRRFRPVNGQVWLDGNEIGSTTGLIVAVDDAGTGAYGTTWAVDTDFLLEPWNAEREGLVWGYDRIVGLGTRSFPSLAYRPAVQITARWGWPSVPEPIKQATRLLTIANWKRKDAPFGVAGFGQFGDIRVREDPDVARNLAPYKRPGIA